MKLELVQFIKTHKDWKEQLAQKPYCLTINRENDYYIFKYNMLDSDMSNKIVQECRGIILYITDTIVLPVCVPFFKFFNIQESNAATIDWESACLQDKIDGSLMKIWYHNGWHLSTNGTIDAFSAEYDDLHHTFGQLFENTLSQALNAFANMENLNTNNTYMFELATKANQLVVEYENDAIYFLGYRNNSTLQEYDVYPLQNKVIKYPRKFNAFNCSAELASAIAETCQEGIVVVDKNFNRVKIKSAAYLAAFHMRNNGQITVKRIYNIIKNNQLDDFVSLVPAWADYAMKVTDIFKSLISVCDYSYNYYFSVMGYTQQQFAKVSEDENTIVRAFTFYKYKHPDVTASDFLSQDRWNKKIIEYIKGELNEG